MENERYCPPPQLPNDSLREGMGTQNSASITPFLRGIFYSLVGGGAECVGA